MFEVKFKTVEGTREVETGEEDTQTLTDIANTITNVLLNVSEELGKERGKTITVGDIKIHVGKDGKVYFDGGIPPLPELFRKISK